MPTTITFKDVYASFNGSVFTNIPATLTSWGQVKVKSLKSCDHIGKKKSKPLLQLTSFPLCWAERVSLRAKTLPQTEISLQTPGAGSDTNSPAGCITRTPLVVRPSINPSDVLHLAARSLETTTQTQSRQMQRLEWGGGRWGGTWGCSGGGCQGKNSQRCFCSVSIFSSVQNDYCTD